MNLNTHYINNAVESNLSNEVIVLLGQLEFKFKKNSASNFRNLVKSQLDTLNLIDNLKVDSRLKVVVQSFKDKVALQTSFSNSARRMLDLVKFQHLYNHNIIQSAIYVVFSKDVAQVVANNTLHAEQIKVELEVYKKIITVPIILIEIKNK